VVELVKEILLKMGIPGILISIIIIIVKINPITSISSSWVELKLSTKEKRLYIRVIRTFFEIVFYVLFLLIITDTFFSTKNIYRPIIAVISGIILLGILIWILILDLKEKSFFDLVKSSAKKWEKISIYFLFLFHFILSIFILPSYYVGTQIYSEFYNESLTKEERLGALIAVIILFLLFIVSIYFTVIKTFYRFLGFRSNLINNLTIKIGNETWYIFHPVEKELFLLGNKPVISQCTKIRFIEKNELLKEQIEIKKDEQ
jgi:hypothetical protein